MIVVHVFNPCMHALTLHCCWCLLVSVWGVTAPHTMAGIIEVTQSHAFLDAGVANSVLIVGRCCAFIWCSLSVSCSAVIAVRWVRCREGPSLAGYVDTPFVRLCTSSRCGQVMVYTEGTCWLCCMLLEDCCLDAVHDGSLQSTCLRPKSSH